jgi:N-acetylmuramoyl-L-alanine amidase
MTPKYITVHCSATPPNRDIGVNEIRTMHLHRGWSDIGYHFVICRDGSVEAGRPSGKVGAHVKGHNQDNIGICLVGGVDKSLNPEDNFTPAQFDSLRELISDVVSHYGIHESNIKGHRDWPNVNKACPCFSVKDKLQEWK